MLLNLGCQDFDESGLNAINSFTSVESLSKLACFDYKNQAFAAENERYSLLPNALC